MSTVEKEKCQKKLLFPEYIVQLVKCFCKEYNVFYTNQRKLEKVKKRVLTKVGISGIIIERPKRGKRKGAEMILEN